MSTGGRPGTARVDILGCRVSRVSMASALSRLEELIREGGAHQVVVLSVPQLMLGRRDRGLFDIWNAASLVLPDGVPLLWASRLLGAPIPGRVAGSDILWELSRVAALRGYSCYLLGSTPEVLAGLEKALRRRFPGLRLVGSLAPPATRVFSSSVDAEIVRRVNAARPDILWVGLGAPRQERWIHAHLGRLDVRVAIGVGAAFDIRGGARRRAPRWMQRAGLEWFHRFLLEPRRLFRRYFIDSAPFLPLVLLQRARSLARYR